MEEQDKYIEALIKLHQGVERQGPGDASFSCGIINQLPELPSKPRIADIGCGAGAGARMLAKKYRSKVKAVDFSDVFLNQMMQQARNENLDKLLEPTRCDMAQLDWPPGSIDLLWSEGAAYSMGFENAIEYWRPFMSPDGIAVISEMSYFSNTPPEDLKQYLEKVYPDIRTESENINLINASGFEVLDTHRLPQQAWWDNYYNPLSEKIKTFADTDDAVMRAVILETEEEMDYFKKFHRDYGYTYYIMKAI